MLLLTFYKALLQKNCNYSKLYLDILFETKGRRCSLGKSRGWRRGDPQSGWMLDWEDYDWKVLDCLNQWPSDIIKELNPSSLCSAFISFRCIEIWLPTFWHKLLQSFQASHLCRAPSSTALSGRNIMQALCVILHFPVVMFLKSKKKKVTLIPATYAISPNVYKTLSQCVVIKKFITYFAFIFCTKSSKCSVFLKYLFYIFINVFLTALGHHCCARAFSSCAKWGNSLEACRLLTAVASPVVEHELWGVGISSRGSQALSSGFKSRAWAWLPPGMRSLPRLGMEPRSPAMAGRFLTTGPQGMFQPAFHMCFTLKEGFPVA